MKSFIYTIKNPDGLDSRNAGALVKEAEKFDSFVTVSKGTRTVNAKGIIGLMELGAKQNDIIAVSVHGADENVAAAKLRSFMCSNF